MHILGPHLDSKCSTCNPPTHAHIDTYSTVRSMHFTCSHSSCAVRKRPFMYHIPTESIYDLFLFRGSPNSQCARLSGLRIAKEVPSISRCHAARTITSGVCVTVIVVVVSGCLLLHIISFIRFLHLQVHSKSLRFKLRHPIYFYFQRSRVLRHEVHPRTRRSASKCPHLRPVLEGRRIVLRNVRRMGTLVCRHNNIGTTTTIRA